jgi:hypothetical protein
MSWSTFVPDLIVTAAGASLTVGIAIVSYLLQLRRKNRQLVFNLADDLAVRRALELIEPREATGDEAAAQYCFDSVHSAQKRISALRDEISPNERLREALHEMVRYCADYKESYEETPELWQFQLMQLRGRLIGSLRKIERVMRIKDPLPTPGDFRP